MKSYAAVTITFNPAVDKSTSVPSLLPEKKLVCAAPLLEPGGGGINVARAITKLGGSALAVFPAGGYNGGLLTDLLKAEKVASLPIPVSGATRENLVVLDRTANLQYRFGMPGPALSPQEWQQCLQALEDAAEPAFFVASGSLSPGMPKDMFARVAVIAKRKKIPLVVDSSGEALAAALDEGVFMIKPNAGELAALAGKDELGLDAIADAAKKLIADKRCEVILVSMGAGGALLVTNRIVQYLPAPPVKRKSTIGAGDSMVAGIVWSLANGMDITEAARYAVACGSAATIQAATGLCSRADVEKLYDLMKMGSGL
ncbi:MAG: 1-phosphofructokinase family hexose kinase [Bacteroidetes bacterium]|nr:1-phosphofructokinase family hexose kinase [Bacteroidota bacterium]